MQNALQKNKSKVYTLLFSIFLFLTTWNKCIDFPLDKLFTVACIFFVGYIEFNNLIFTAKEKLLLLSFIGLSAITSIVNFTDAQGVIWFIPVGLLFIMLYYKSAYSSNKNTFYILSAYVFLSLLLLAHSYAFNFYDYVHPLYDKGMPHIHAPKGFSPTVQVLGTYCVLAIFIYFEEKDKKNITTKDTFLLLMHIFCILISFSRSTQLALLLLLFYRNIALFIGMGILSTIILLVVFPNVLDAVFTLETVSSRESFIRGFVYAFFDTGGSLVQLFGNGSVLISSFDMGQTNALHDYVENGTAAILNIYGFVGLGVFLVAAFSGLSIFYKAKYISGLLFYALYVFIIPQSTHEFLATSFYLVLGVLFKYSTALKIKN